MSKKPMTVTSREVTVRDFVIFQLKLVLDGLKDAVAFWCSFFAITIDFIAGRGRRPRLFYSVVRASERFDRWINLHSVLEDMDAHGDGEGLLGAGHEAKDATFLGDIERFVRGDEETRKAAMDDLKTRGDKIKRKGEQIRRAVVDPPPEDPYRRQDVAPHDTDPPVDPE